MKVYREQKKMEAIHRMQAAGIPDDIIVALDDEDKIFISEQPFGLFVELNEEELDRVRKFEQKHNVLVYMVIRSATHLGMMDSLLFVNDDVSEWYMDREDLESKTAFAYVYNHVLPVLSEFGQIGWENGAAGGLLRTT